MAVAAAKLGVESAFVGCIAVCPDFVMNHTSGDHEWAKKAREGDPEYRRRYFFYDT